MDDIKFYIIVRTCRRFPGLKDILDKAYNPLATKYSSLSDATSHLSRFLDGDAEAIFGISDPKIYHGNGSVAYCQRSLNVAPNQTIKLWFEHHDDYIQYYDQNGYFLGSVSRLGFVPKENLTVKGGYDNRTVTLHKGERYPMGVTHPSVGVKYYISHNNAVVYKPKSFWEDNGVIVEHW